MGLGWGNEAWGEIRLKRGEEHCRQREQHMSKCQEEAWYAWLLEIQKAKEMEVWQETWGADKGLMALLATLMFLSVSQKYLEAIGWIYIRESEQSDLSFKTWCQMAADRNIFLLYFRVKQSELKRLQVDSCNWEGIAIVQAKNNGNLNWDRGNWDIEKWIDIRNISEVKWQDIESNLVWCHWR